MNYLIIGAGGTGGCLAAYLALADKDVSVIARGTQLCAIQKNGIVLETGHGTFAVPVTACDTEHYSGKPDVVFLCVKGYGLEGILPFLHKICDSHTIVIPILNIYGTGGQLQPQLPNTLVTDGCIYIAAEIKSPGTILMSGDIFRIFFGVRDPGDYRPQLETIARDLRDAGIDGVLSDDIRRDALLKFSYVSPMAACGLYHNALAREMQQPGTVREDFCALIREIDALAHAMSISFPEDPVQRNLKILDALAPTASTSLKRDIDAGKPSEVDGLIFQVVRLGRQYGIPTPVYDKVAAYLGYEVESQ